MSNPLSGRRKHRLRQHNRNKTVDTSLLNRVRQLEFIARSFNLPKKCDGGWSLCLFNAPHSVILAQAEFRVRRMLMFDRDTKEQLIGCAMLLMFALAIVYLRQ